MRVVRTFVGLVLVLLGAAALVIATISWNAMSRRDADGRFTATLAPVSTEGYAVVLPDLAEQADPGDRFGLSWLLGEGPLQITATAPEPVLLAVGPTSEVDSYLTGVGHTEVTAVGYADGPQPVSVAAIDGTVVPAPIHDQTFYSARASSAVRWMPGGDAATALVVVRADGAPGFDATISVSREAAGLTALTWALLLGGGLGFLGGIVVLFWPAPAREMVLVLEAHRMVDVADRIAEKVSGAKQKRTKPGAVRRLRMHDLTGEVLAISPEAFPTARPGRDEGPGNGGRNGTLDTARHDGTPDNPRHDDAAATRGRNRRDGWPDRDRGESRHDFATTNQRRRAEPGLRNHRFGRLAEEASYLDDLEAAMDEGDFDAGAYDGHPAASGTDAGTGESPYIHTAT